MSETVLNEPTGLEILTDNQFHRIVGEAQSRYHAEDFNPWQFTVMPHQEHPFGDVAHLREGSNQDVSFVRLDWSWTREGSDLLCGGYVIEGNRAIAARLLVTDGGGFLFGEGEVIDIADLPPVNEDTLFEPVRQFLGN